MPQQQNPAKAELRELDAKFENEINGDKTVRVQFNPETLKVSYANQIAQPEGGGDQRGAQSQLFVGAGTTKLSCQLWFDVGSPQVEQSDPAQSRDIRDVRQLTNRVTYFITPRGQTGSGQGNQKKFVPPAVRFLWGSFQFDGIIESLEESLELFSSEGRPLRASMSLTMTQQKIQTFPPKSLEGQQNPPGSTPTVQVPDGGSVQQTMGPGWQDSASRNRIEDPLHPPPGQRLRR